MAFQFRYERLLQYRADLERQALLGLAQVQKRLQHEQQSLRSLQREARRAREDWAGFVGRSGTMDEIRLVRSKRTAAEGDVRRQQKVVGEWESRLDEARRAWLEARRSKKMIELLKERAWKEYRTAVNRAEAQHLDEVSLRPFVRDRDSADIAGAVDPWTEPRP